MRSTDRGRSVFALAAVALLVAVAAPAARAQYARPGELSAIDAAVRAAVVESVAVMIDSVYVDGEGAALITAHLRSQLAAGAYDELTDPAALVLRLEEEAQTVHHDGHFGLRVLPPADPAEDAAPDPLDRETWIRRQREANFGFAKVEILPGNIGYLKLDMFADTEYAAETAAAAMNYLANTRAVIIDLRENGGGAATMIRFLAGYLFEESTHLINWYQRAKDRTIQSWSADVVPGRRLSDVPVYVLTSRSTFSAAEEFTFDLKHLERATIIGDTTGGGGNTVAGHVFDFDGFRVESRLPYGHAYDPKTGDGWEGTGVAPHIAVPSAQALLTAHREALVRGLETVEDDQGRVGMEWALAGLESRLHPVTLTRGQLKEYQGSFGPRRVFLEDGVLYYQREDRPRFALEPMGKDLFRVGDLEYFRLEFARDAAGRITKVVGHYNNGRQDENPRDAGR